MPSGPSPQSPQGGAGTSSGLASAFSRLARGEPANLAADLTRINGHQELDGTLALTHCYSLGLDGMGWPRVGLLVENICSLIVDYAIPRSKIAHAVEQCQESGLQGPLLRLQREAQGLFTHLKNSGEGGELLLFCLAETVLGFPQILAKMSLKTSSAMHYHGADGVHASVDAATGKLRLWWGESKLHQTPADAIRETMDSLAPFLIEPQSSHARRTRDLNLLRYGVDLNDVGLEEAIKAYLDTSSGLYRQLSFGGIALVGFNHDCYPAHPQKADAEEIAASILAHSDRWKQGLAKHIARHKLEEIDLHLFFLPFPSVDDFRKLVLNEVGVA